MNFSKIFFGLVIFLRNFRELIFAFFLSFIEFSLKVSKWIWFLITHVLLLAGHMRYLPRPHRFRRSKNFRVLFNYLQIKNLKKWNLKNCWIYFYYIYIECKLFMSLLYLYILKIFNRKFLLISLLNNVCIDLVFFFNNVVLLHDYFLICLNVPNVFLYIFFYADNKAFCLHNGFSIFN